MSKRKDDGSVEYAVERAWEFACCDATNLPHTRELLERTRTWLNVAMGRMADGAYRGDAAHEQIAALTAERARWIKLAIDAHDVLELAEPNHSATRALDDAINQIDVVTLAVALRTADEGEGS